jgi:hypothetical protein
MKSSERTAGQKILQYNENSTSSPIWQRSRCTSSLIIPQWAVLLLPIQLVNHTSKSNGHNLTKYNTLPILQALVNVTIWFVGHTMKLSGLAQGGTSRTDQTVTWSCNITIVISRFHKCHWTKINYWFQFGIPKSFLHPPPQNNHLSPIHSKHNVTKK